MAYVNAIGTYCRIGQSYKCLKVYYNLGFASGTARGQSRTHL